MQLKKWSIFKRINAIASSICGTFVRTIDFRKEQQEKRLVLKKASVVAPSFSYFHTKETYYWMHFKAIQGVPHFTVTINNAKLVSKGIVVNENGSVILENCIFQQEYLDQLFSNHFIKLRGLLPLEETGKVISLGNRLDNNYFHWATESLTRLLIVSEFASFKEYHIVIKTGSQPFIKESLLFLFDIDDTQLIEKPLTTVLKTKETLVISFPHVRNEQTNWTNVYDPTILKRLNERALDRIKKHAMYKGGQPQCILISRKNALERRTINENELLVALNNYNVDLVYLETLSFIEQVVLFAKTKVIIGVHGAGLTNCLYCENATLIEFFPKNRNPRDGFYFTQITGALSMEHHFITYTEANEFGDLHVTETQITDLKMLLDNLL